MCLVAFAIHASARWPLVIASNRDESFERPTLPLKRWDSDSGQVIISGRDVHAGGTWLGATADGRIAFLTNVREPASTKKPAPRSRGELVVEWLQGRHTATEFMARINPGDYGGFNLVVGDWRANAWTWMGNRPDAAYPVRNALPGWIYRELQAGVYGLSNAALDTPWPKTLALKAALTGALTEAVDADSAQGLEGRLWEALASTQRADDDALPATGVPRNMERALSSAFVYAPERAYGTRSSTLLIAGTNATAADSGDQINLRIGEKTFQSHGPSNQPDPANCASSFTSQALAWPATPS